MKRANQGKSQKSKSENKNESENKKEKDCPDLFYVHNVSPLKKSAAGSDYFDLMLQNKDGAKKTLCFSPVKRRRLSDAMVTKSPVKLQNHRFSKGTIYLNPNTTITPVDPQEVAFSHNSKLAEDAVVSLKDLRQLASGQIVNIRANILKCNDVIVHKGVNGDVPKVECTIRDSTECCQMTLYGDDVNLINEGDTYLMKNLRLHIVKNACYLNSTLSVKFCAQKIDPFDNVVDAAEPETDAKMVASIKGIFNVSRSFICNICSKRSTGITTGVFKCEHCDCRMMAGCCKVSWFVKLVFEDTSSKEVYTLVMSNDVIHQFASLTKLDLTTTTEDDLVKRFLETSEPLVIVFNAISKQIKNLKFAVDC